MINKICILILLAGLFSYAKAGIAEELPMMPAGEPEEGSCCTIDKSGKLECTELAKTMKKIDQNYKEIKKISGYYEFGEKEWDIILVTSKNLIENTKKVINEFPRPDDAKYQDLNKTLLAESEILHEVAHYKNEIGAVEDAQWQVRKIRHTCSSCHKHLGLHIYPNLYPKDEKKSSVIKK